MAPFRESARFAPIASLLLLLVCMASTWSCCATDCGAPFDRSSPAATIESFHRAIRCDDADAEYRCFSNRAKTSFGALAGYSLAREILRERDPLALRFIENADVRGRTRIRMTADGNHAEAVIDIGGDRTLDVLLVNEPEYRLFHADGKVTTGYGERIDVTPRRNGFTANVTERDIEIESTAEVQRLEFLQRWVIDEFPGLAAAVDAANRERDGADRGVP